MNIQYQVLYSAHSILLQTLQQLHSSVSIQGIVLTLHHILLDLSQDLDRKNDEGYSCLVYLFQSEVEISFLDWGAVGDSKQD